MCPSLRIYSSCNYIKTTNLKQIVQGGGDEHHVLTTPSGQLLSLMSQHAAAAGGGGGGGGGFVLPLKPRPPKFSSVLNDYMGACLEENCTIGELASICSRFYSIDMCCVW